MMSRIGDIASKMRDFAAKIRNAIPSPVKKAWAYLVELRESYALLIYSICFIVMAVAQPRMVQLLREAPESIDVYSFMLAFLQATIWSAIMFSCFARGYKERFMQISLPKDVSLDNVKQSMIDSKLIKTATIRADGKIIEIFSGIIRVVVHYDGTRSANYQLLVCSKADRAGVSKIIGFDCEKRAAKWYTKLLIFLGISFIIYSYHILDSQFAIDAMSAFLNKVLTIVGLNALIACGSGMLLAAFSYCIVRLLGGKIVTTRLTLQTKEMRMPRVDFLAPEFLHKLHQKGIELVSGCDGEYFFNSARDCHIYRVVCDGALGSEDVLGEGGCGGGDRNTAPDCKNTRAGEAAIVNNADNVQDNNDEIEVCESISAATDCDMRVKIVGSRSFIRRFTSAI